MKAVTDCSKHFSNTELCHNSNHTTKSMALSVHRAVWNVYRAFLWSLSYALYFERKQHEKITCSTKKIANSLCYTFIHIEWKGCFYLVLNNFSVLFTVVAAKIKQIFRSPVTSWMTVVGTIRICINYPEIIRILDCSPMEMSLME